MMIQAVRLLIRGRVQGVGFRYFTLQEAEKLGVKGSVRNCSDGSVEVIAVAEPTRLAQFIEVLQRGPRFARVSGVEQETIFLDHMPTGFTITH